MIFPQSLKDGSLISNNFLESSFSSIRNHFWSKGQNQKKKKRCDEYEGSEFHFLTDLLKSFTSKNKQKNLDFDVQKGSSKATFFVNFTNVPM